MEVLFSLSPLEPAGCGTEANPFLIASPENLVWMEKQAEYSENFFYTLTADIDLRESEYWRGGLGFPPIGTETAPFSGTFDGNNFTIKNLGTGITKEQIADKLTYTGWDFINIWQFYPGDSFPTIRPYSPYA